MKTAKKVKKNRKTKKVNNCTKMYGSVCSSEYTLKSNKGPVAGINQYTQITVENDNNLLWGRGIQLWKGTKIADMQGYIKEQDWNNPNNFRIKYWELKKLGGGPLNQLLPSSKLKAHGTMTIIDANGKYANSKGLVQKCAASFDMTGNNFTGVIC
tara:strand:+ start:1107 stop:1571 length:465 start_codon:yes stop_codon:yes gene_type:complete